ncbi:Ku protein, partial [Streptomyces sp. NPDC059786]
DEIGKGYEVTKGQVVPVRDEELRELPLPTARAIEIEAFVPEEDIDPLRIGDGYYLQADGGVAAKPYTLLRKALERSSKVAVAKYAWSGRERLGILRVRDDAIVLHSMRWPDEVRSPAELAPPAERVSQDEIDGARLLMERMSRDDLEGEEFTDRYTQALEQLIEAKREGRQPPEMPAQEAPEGKVMDLMAALEKSVRAARQSRGEGEDATVHELPKKKAPAKKTAAKTAKKAPAKKTAKKPAAGTADSATHKDKTAQKDGAAHRATGRSAAKKPRRSA